MADWESEKESDKKRFWRYRWPDEIRDEVLGRLIALNAMRAEQERKSKERSVASVARRPRTTVPPRPEVPLDDEFSRATSTLFAGDSE